MGHRSRYYRSIIVAAAGLTYALPDCAASRAQSDVGSEFVTCFSPVEGPLEIIEGWIAEILARYPSDPNQAAKAIVDEILLPFVQPIESCADD
jgi:hypothetical protein